MFMIEMNWKCACGSNEMATHQSGNLQEGDTFYGYCSECGLEHSMLVTDCRIFKVGDQAGSLHVPTSIIFGVIDKIVTLADVAHYKRDSYTTIYTDNQLHEGKPFEIIRSLNAGEVDMECAPMFKIRFEDGVEIDAYIEEVYHNGFFDVVNPNENLDRSQATDELDLKTVVEDLSRRFDACGISPKQWEEGYTSDDVEEVLDYLQLVLTRSMNIQCELVMVWDCLDKFGEFPAGDSEVWILSKHSEGYVGASITTPFISSDALEGFLKNVLDFREGTLTLKPVTFKRFSTFNMIRIN